MLSGILKSDSYMQITVPLLALFNRCTLDKLGFTIVGAPSKNLSDELKITVFCENRFMWQVKSKIK
ncbi:hypothetical protein DWW69_03125 [Bacteroides sp. AF16-49]|nr:hypothetical protein DWW69_03125 [Bacteroides sp. AF16-49]